MFTRLHWRIAAGYVVLIVVALLALGTYLVVTVRDRQLRDLEDHLYHEATLIADLATARVVAGARPADLDALAKSLGPQIGARVTFIDRSGVVLGDSESDPATMGSDASRPEVVDALNLAPGASQPYSKALDRDLLYIAVPMRSNATVIGVTRVALSVSDVDRTLNQAAVVVAGATATAGALAVLLAVLIARVTTEPIGRLTDMIKLVAAGDLTQRVVVESRDELGDLGAAFNNMASELRASIGAIDEQRAELTAILAGMADGVMIVDEGDRVVALNRAAERMLEVSNANAAGRTVAEVARRHELVAQLESAHPDDRPLVIEVGPDRRQVQVVVTPIRVGLVARQVVLFQDVTMLRRAEAMRRDFVANVSHELRTPLASLQALVETLEDGALEDPPAAREFLGRMQIEVDGLRQMVEELLELSRIESGRMKLRLEAADVGDMAHEAARRLLPQAERHGVLLSIQTPDESLDAPIDSARMQQVVVNLVHNAIKFTPPRGRIDVSFERRGKFAAIVVADTGIGVEPSELPRLFERFYKVDRSRSSSGTGLGLAIVKHLVQAHGGRVWAESEGEGQGTTFVVLLPLAPTSVGVLVGSE